METLQELYTLWDLLADIPVTDYGKTKQSFLHFPKHTDREDIWRWFEEQNPAFLVGEVMEGKRVPPGATHEQKFYGDDKYYQRVEYGHLNQVSEEWQMLTRWNVWDNGKWVDVGAWFSNRNLRPIKGT